MVGGREVVTSCFQQRTSLPPVLLLTKLVLSNGVNYIFLYFLLAAIFQLTKPFYSSSHHLFLWNPLPYLPIHCIYRMGTTGQKFKFLSCCSFFSRLNGRFSVFRNLYPDQLILWNSSYHHKWCPGLLIMLLLKVQYYIQCTIGDPCLWRQSLIWALS